ncbi:MAG: TatD family hydrolase [Desulfobacterales bacterium]|nr:TatD family hydrolase [Desulfobacterales bacterium]
MYIDSHTHLDHVYNKHPERIEWLKIRECVPISWSFGLNIKDKNDLKKYLEKQSETIQDLNSRKLECYHLSGIHPRNITPDLKPEDIEALLLPFLDNPACLGLGEVGLEYGDEREMEILSAQLALGNQICSMGKIIGIHTPRNSKYDVTQQLFTLLDGFPDINEITVIDHCTSEIIGDILKRGYHAGITVSPIKSSLGELNDMIQCYSESTDKIMCNTDSGTSFYETLYEFVISKDFPDEIKRKISFENAQSFYLKR